MAAYGDVYISAVTISELLVGVHHEREGKRRVRHLAYVEAVLARLPVLDFDAEVARVHAQGFATLADRGQLIDAHDLLIAATALTHGCAVATENVQEFRRVPGLAVTSLKVEERGQGETPN